MKLKIFQVDAFCDKIFGGNPAAVCPLDAWISKDLMQKIAAENNLSETVFFVRRGSDYEIKWFTPEIEVDLCGHATLAAAHVLYDHLGYKEQKIIFHSNSGELSVRKENGMLCMNFPLLKLEKADAPHDLTQAIGIKPDEVYKGVDYFLILNSEKEVLELQPDFEKLKKVKTRGVIVSAKGIKSDFVSRFFAPAAGINEDPVTGSAHTILIPYWAEKLNKKDLHALQVSKRGGELFCKLLDNRVEMSGKAKTYLIGEIETE